MNIGQLLLFAALAALAWVGWSQLHDDATLRAQADEVACLGKPCTLELDKKARDLFGYTFTYHTYAEHSRFLTVVCTRPLWVFGSYRCDVSSEDTAGDVRFLTH